jgi:hypothetical protein
MLRRRYNYECLDLKKKKKTQPSDATKVLRKTKTSQVEN